MTHNYLRIFRPEWINPILKIASANTFLKFKWQTIDYFSLSSFGEFGGLEWSKVESRINDELTGGQYRNQNFGDGERDTSFSFLKFWCTSMKTDVVVFISDAHQDDGRGRQVYNDMHALEDSMVLIPELTLTAPTPELGYSGELLPRGLLNDDGCDYQGDNIIWSAAMAELGVPNELEFVTPLVGARRSNALGTGTDPEDPLDKGHNRRSFLGKKLEGILTGRLFSRSGNEAFLSGDMAGVSGRKAEMRTSRNGFGWLVSRRDKDNGDRNARKAGGTGRSWKKRLSQILEGATEASSGHSTSASGLERARESPRTGKLVDTWPKVPPVQERPPSWGSFGNHLGSGKNLLEERCFGSTLLERPTRVNEEGEHAASRLFGTPNTGIRMKTIASSRNWYGGDSGETSREDSTKLEKPRRHSFGIDLQSWRFGGRRRGATEDVDADELGVREKGNGGGWGVRRSVAF